MGYFVFTIQPWQLPNPAALKLNHELKGMTEWQCQHGPKVCGNQRHFPRLAQTLFMKEWRKGSRRGADRGLFSAAEPRPRPMRTRSYSSARCGMSAFVKPGCLHTVERRSLCSVSQACPFISLQTAVRSLGTGSPAPHREPSALETEAHSTTSPPIIFHLLPICQAHSAIFNPDFCLLVGISTRPSISCFVLPESSLNPGQLLIICIITYRMGKSAHKFSILPTRSTSSGS